MNDEAIFDAIFSAELQNCHLFLLFKSQPIRIMREKIIEYLKSLALARDVLMFSMFSMLLMQLL